MTALTEERELQVYTAQEQWIRRALGDQAAESANYGWAVDEVEGTVSTKIYGHGVLTTDAELKHTYEEV